MEGIKFVGKFEKEKEFAKAVRRNVNDYFVNNNISKKGDYTMVIKAVAMLSLYIVPFVIILSGAVGPWMSMLMWVIIGIGMAGIGMGVMHDACHGSFSEKEWVNKLFGYTMYLMGASILTWKMQHNVMHHTYTNIAGLDDDIGSRGPLRFNETVPVKKINRFQYIHAFFFYGLLSLARITRDFTLLNGYEESGLMKKDYNSKVVFSTIMFVKVLFFFVFIGLPILLTSLTWWQVLIGFFVSQWVGGVILGTIFQMAHLVDEATQPLPNEDGIIEKSWMVHELETTANFARKNKFLKWYVGGLNFQIEHHLFPHICHIHYSEISPIVEKTAKEYGFKYNDNSTFMKALSSHIHRLKTLGVSGIEPAFG